jgi:hypothetical protein
MADLLEFRYANTGWPELVRGIKASIQFLGFMAEIIGIAQSFEQSARRHELPHVRQSLCVSGLVEEGVAWFARVQMDWCDSFD